MFQNNDEKVQEKCALKWQNVQRLIDIISKPLNYVDVDIPQITITKMKDYCN